MDVTSSSTVKLQWVSPVDTAAVHSYKVLDIARFCLAIFESSKKILYLNYFISLFL